MSAFSQFRVWAYGKYSKYNRWKLRKIYGMDIGYNVRISRNAVLDRSRNPKGIHIGDNCMLTGYVTMLAHDHCRNILTDTYLGNNCFVGGNAFIMPGVKIGDHVVIGSCSVVTKDIPSHSMVVGNPARIIRTGVVLDDNCKIIDNGKKVE